MLHAEQKQKFFPNFFSFTRNITFNTYQQNSRIFVTIKDIIYWLKYVVWFSPLWVTAFYIYCKVFEENWKCEPCFQVQEYFLVYDFSDQCLEVHLVYSCYFQQNKNWNISLIVPIEELVWHIYFKNLWLTASETGLTL